MNKAVKVELKVVLTRENRIFEEYQNTGDGSDTSARVTETTATASVTKGQLWPNGYSWIDTSY